MDCSISINLQSRHHEAALIPGDQGVHKIEITKSKIGDQVFLISEKSEI
jgi:hypothetical protein